MHETEIDGVAVLWADAPGPLTATLMFGCGARDETFRTIGITHLVEHLVMSTLPRVHYDHNASVDMEVTEFYAAGRPEHVVEFLHTVCAGLDDLPVDRLSKEAGVLAAEGGAPTHHTAAALLSNRFGAEGPGLAMWDGRGFDRLTAAMAQAHVERFFVRSNAVLTITGEPPADLRLPLRDGPPPSRTAPRELVWPGPRYAEESVTAPGLALSGRTAETRCATTVGVLRERLVTAARHERGISYDVGSCRTLVDAGRAELAIWLDARDGQESAAATVLWQAAIDLAAQGPTEAELAHDVAGLRHTIEDPRFPSVDVDAAAHARLLGVPYRPPGQLLAEVEAVTPHDVTAYLTSALDTALLVVPEDCAVELTGLDGRPLARGGCPPPAGPPAGGRTIRPARLARLVNREARAARLVVDDTGLLFVDGDGDAHDVRYADVVGVQRDEDGRVLYTRQGCLAPVLRSMWSGVQPVIDAIDRQVPAELHYAPTELC